MNQGSNVPVKPGTPVLTEPDPVLTDKETLCVDVFREILGKMGIRVIDVLKHMDKINEYLPTVSKESGIPQGELSQYFRAGFDVVRNRAFSAPPRDENTILFRLVCFMMGNDVYNDDKLKQHAKANRHDPERFFKQVREGQKWYEHHMDDFVV